MATEKAEAERARRAEKAEARAAVAEPKPAQLPLLPVAGEDAEAPREGGRPAGSVARATAEWRAMLLRRYRSPLIGMAETFNRPAKDLAGELGCTVYEAFQLQMRAMTELAPYLHGRMPTALQLDGAPTVAVGIALTPQMAAAIGVQTGGLKIEEFQEVKPEGEE